MASHPPNPADGDDPAGNNKELPSLPIHVVTKPSQLPVEFLEPSAAHKLVIGFDCEGVDQNGDLCIMQIAFPDAVYLVDAIEGGKELVEACKPALESDCITKVTHDCRRDSEALYFQFGIKLHNVMDTQIAFALIEEQERKKRAYDDYISFVSLLADPHYCGMTYPEKEEVLTLLRQEPNFWKSRPLSEIMIRAATDDVRFLLRQHERIMEKLSKVSLWCLVVQSELYCRCFCINDNELADWPPLSTIPDDIEAEVLEMLQGLKLLPEYINPAHQIGSGPILLDYGGTVMPQQLINEASSQELIFTLNGLFSDPQLAEWVTSGQWNDELAQRFVPFEGLEIPAENGYFIRRVVNLIIQYIQRFREIAQDGESAADLGIQLSSLAAKITALSNQVTEGTTYLNKALPYLELFVELAGDGPMGALARSSVSCLKCISTMAGTTTGAFKVGARACTVAGFHLQLRRPGAQPGCKQRTRARDFVLVSSVDEAWAVIKAWEDTPELVEADVPEDMGRDEALEIYRLFVRNQAYDLICESTVLLSKLKDGQEDDWVIA